jgi:hypothetical protein
MSSFCWASQRIMSVTPFHVETGIVALEPAVSFPVMEPTPHLIFDSRIWRKPEDAAKTLDELSSRDEELYRFEKMLEGEGGLIYLLDGLGGLLVSPASLKTK